MSFKIRKFVAFFPKMIKTFILIAVVVQPSFANTPNVTLTPSVIFDSICSQKTGYKINEAWRDELNARLPGMQRKWNIEGAKLLEATTQIIGNPFVASDYISTLSLCSFPSMSSPLLINMRYSLESFTKNALPSDVSISIIYHELLHTYLANIILKDSLLLKKHSHESQTVKDHLHLFALMKTVYLSLGMKQQLHAIINKDASLPNKDYKRTWEIINSEGGYQHFIKELKSSNSNK